jgi:inhibitor of cysteine peptidase
MRSRLMPLSLFAALVLLVVAGCTLASACAEAPAPVSPSEPTPGGASEGLAPVDEIDILILESYPVQVHVVARGQLSDAATVIDGVTQERAGDTIRVRVYTARDPDAIAAQVLTPFEETIPLDLRGLGIVPGVYTVDVNGVTAPLTLDATMLGH